MLDKYSNNHSIGTLYLTVTHLIFVERSGKKKIWVNYLSLIKIIYRWVCVKSNIFLRNVIIAGVIYAHL